MNIRTLGRIVAVVAGIVALYVVSLVIRQWQYPPVAGYEIRRNRITGKVQVKAGGQWTAFETDPYAVSLTTEELKQVVVKDIVWGADGILCARAVNRSQQSLKGRLGFQIIIRDAFDNKWVKDRTLRETVDLPAGSETPFAIDTGLDTPDITRRKTTIVPVPTTYSEANSPS